MFETRPASLNSFTVTSSHLAIWREADVASVRRHRFVVLIMIQFYGLEAQSKKPV